MGNFGIRKLGAIALCCAVVTAGMPRLTVGNHELANAVESIIDWQNRLAQMEQPQTDTQPFVSLRYDAQKGILYRDGTPVGDRCGEYAVVDGELMLSAKAAGMDNAHGEFVPVKKAAAAIGCEVKEDETGVTLTSPFASAALIVKSTSAVDPLGAVDVVDGYADLHILQYATPADAYAAYLTYAEDAAVEYVEPSRTVSVASVGAETAAYSYTTDENTDWGVSAIGADTYNTWLVSAYETLPEITVAVIDTGIYAEHERFAGRLAGTGSAFLDEASYSVNDEHGHGTHCAGIITGATTDNVKILPVRALDSGGYGSILGIYCGMMYALEQGVDVVSMSLGIDGESPLVLDAVDQLYEAGILCCVASGNETMPAEYVSPAQNTNCITVGALDSALEIAWFSNYGPELDLAAPGVDVYSADISAPDGYVAMSGTSMATPYVAAACAMVLSADDSLSVDTVEAYLKANAMDLGDAGYDEYFGYGMVQMADFRFSADRCEMPIADMESGSYDDKVTVSLRCETEGAVIYYTLDGSVPTAENGILYEGPITLTASAVLSAVAYKGDAASRVMVERYVIDGLDVEDALVIENGVLVAYQGVLTELDLYAEDFTAVGDKAFYGNTTLEEVVLPDTVTVIGDSAFENCTNLWSVTAYGVTAVGERAFMGCMSMSWCDTAPLETLGVSAFEGCKNLYDCNLSEELTEIPDRLLMNSFFAGYLYLPNVTVVGDHAFDSCYNIELEGIDWTAMTHIGDYAFEGCYLQDYEIALDSIEHLGEYAFSATRIDSLTLPETVTVIPEGLLLGACELAYLSAPGVTEIGAYGLATDVMAYTSYVKTVTELDFAKITAVGEMAFSGYYFDSYAEFTTLTEIGPYAFSAIAGAPLSFPAVTAVPQEAFAFCENAAIYFENAAAVESFAIAYVNCPVVFSDACTEFAEEAIFESTVIAAPAGSAVETYAKENDIEFIATPALYCPRRDYVFTVMDTPVISGVALGFDLRYQWYDADGDPIAGATDYRYEPQVPVDTTAVYTLQITDTEGAVVDFADIFVTVESVTISDTLTVGTPSVFDHKSLQAQYDEEVGHLWIDFAFYRHYTFTPEADGTYYFYATGDTYSTSLQLHDVSYVDYYGGSYHYISAELTAGVEYLVTVTFTSEDFVGAVGVTDVHPDESYNDLYYTYWEENYETVIPDAYPYEPHPTLYDYVNSVELVEGVDYQLVYMNNESPGSMYVYAIGLGDYIGRSEPLVLDLTAVAEENVPMVFDPSKTDSNAVYYQFTPEYSGEYHIYTKYPMSYYSGDSISTFADPVLTIYDDDSLYEHCDDYEGYYGSTLLSALTVTLEAGVCYTLECDSYGDGAYEVLITQTQRNLLDCMMETDGETTILLDPYGEQLVESVDYDLYTLSDGYDTYIFADGIGAYYGTIYTAFYSDVPGYDGEVPTEYVDIRPDTDFNVDTAVSYYRMEVTEEGSYALTADVPIDVYSDIYFYLYDEATNTMELYTQTYADYPVYLPEGVYFIYFPIPEDYSLVSDTFRFRMVTSIQFAEITIEDLYYNGEEQYPTVTVTLDGVTLTEGVDYELWGDLSATMCGVYYVTINGIGDYCDTRFESYSILPSLDDVKGELTDGQNTISIPAAGDCPVYTWTPRQSAEYCFAAMTLNDVTVTVMTANGEPLCVVTGYDEAFDFGRFTAGEQYFVTAQFKSKDVAGEIPLAILTGMTALDYCDIEVEETLYYNGEAHEPSVVVRDGEKVLTEGVDYEIVAYGANVNAGRATVCLKGMGNYIGRAEAGFIIYYETLDEGIMSEAMPMDYNYEEQALYYETPYSYFVYSLSNESSAPDYYSLTLYDYESMTVVQAYDQYGYPIIDFNPNSFAVASGETMYLLLIADSVRWYLGYECSFALQTQAYLEYVCDGVIYHVNTDYALIAGVTGDRFAYDIPEQVFDESTMYNPVSVYGFEDSFYYDYAQNTQIFYVETWDGVGELLEDMGFVVVCLSDVSQVAGDLDGSGDADYDDVILMNAWLTETEGVRVNDTNLPNADLNSDGIYDYSDLVILTEMNHIA